MSGSNSTCRACMLFPSPSVVCLNPAAGDAFARLLYPYALVPRLCKLATGATQAGPEACKTDLTLGPKVVAAALEVLLNISLVRLLSLVLFCLLRLYFALVSCCGLSVLTVPPLPLRCSIASRRFTPARFRRRRRHGRHARAPPRHSLCARGCSVSAAVPGAHDV
jgi:hypothetical protein